MARRARPELPAAVTELRDRIEYWRQTRERRTTMPPDLWAAAATLAKRHGVYRVAHGTGVSFDGLKRRMAEAAGRSATVSSPAAFVELSGAHLLSDTMSPGPGTVVELSDAAGTRLTIRLGRQVELDMAGLVTAFRQRGA